MAISEKSKVRVRIAPSPTGYLHIGTARTALFNWLFARKNAGTFVLRIEDTDLERSEKRFEKDIIEGLKWLGLEWDEGPIRQSDRLEIYEKYISKLLEDELAYYCFCSKEELETERQAMLTQGFAPKYSGKCRSLAAEEVKKKLKAGTGHVIRFKVPETKITFKDLIRGNIAFDTALIGDIAIAKNPRAPLYNFAVVIDDEEMKISHVIRGEDHIANTPKQILIQKALGFPHPHYAHLPLILDPDRSKMSKRYSATSIQDYRDAGYLPEALTNFIALLGWHPQGEKEVLNMAEIVQEFDLGRVQKAGAVFNVNKLDWLNSQYIRNTGNEIIAQKLQLAPTKENLKIIEITKGRMKKLTDFKELAGFFFELPNYPPALLIWKDASKKNIIGNLKSAEEILAAVSEESFIQANLEKLLMPLAEERGRGEVFWPLRAALSGSETSPGPFEIMEAVGKKETIKRIKAAIIRLGNVERQNPDAKSSPKLKF